MFYYSCKRIPVKTSSNMLSLILIDIKFWSSFACFTASSGYEGMFSVADILHIADVIRQVYSCCSCYAFRQQFSYFFFMKCVKCQMPFPTTLQKLSNLIPRTSCLPFLFLAITLYYLTSCSGYHRHLPNLVMKN